MRSALLGAVLLMAALTASAFAQAPPAGMLHVTVVDPSGAVVVGATVTVAGADPATSAATIEPVTSANNGIATVPGLAPGRYTIQAEFPGFETRVLKDIRVRAGDNKQVAVLPLPKLEATLTVEQDKQEAAADRNRSFGTVLTRDEIERCRTIRDAAAAQTWLPGCAIASTASRAARCRQGADSLHSHLARSICRRVSPRAAYIGSSRSPDSVRPPQQHVAVRTDRSVDGVRSCRSRVPSECAVQLRAGRRAIGTRAPST